jgi:hypothetical protein
VDGGSELFLYVADAVLVGKLLVRMCWLCMGYGLCAGRGEATYNRAGASVAGVLVYNSN